MSNTVKKLKIEHCSMNSVWFFSWSVEIYMCACQSTCMRANLHACVPKSIMSLRFIITYYEAHISTVFMLVCLMVFKTPVSTIFQLYYGGAVFFIGIDFLAIKRKRGRFFK